MNFRPDQAQALGLIRDVKGNWIQPKKAPTITPQVGEVEPLEGPLHGKIRRWLDDRGWLYVHSRMDCRTTVEVGEVDFVIAAPGGRTLWLEVKARREKPKIKQQGRAMQLRTLGHSHAFVWNMQDFEAAIQMVSLDIT